MRLSIIIPVLDEESTIASTLKSLGSFPVEAIVVDGGSQDRTADIAGQMQVRVIASSRGRARQMNTSAAAAQSDVLLFLHADTRLPSSAIGDVVSALDDPRYVGGRFDLRLDHSGIIFRLIGSLISLRSRLTRIATGDQAIFVRRGIFDAINGFPEIPILEDIAFCRNLKKMGKVACLRTQVVTSARRWQKDGVGRTILKMWVLKFLFLIGVSPFRLKRFYAEVR
ncbi:MAG: glycosyltransferase [Deltaproteobacteria bacterium]|nr:MAG: glycosyltransferase [Deltaproteobacteria bacterium]